MNELRIGTGPNQIVATVVTTGADSVILVDNDQWDEMPEIDREVVEKPTSDGDWTSEHIRFKAKNLDVTLQAVYNLASVRNLRDKLSFWYGAKSFPVEFIRTDDGNTVSEIYDKCFFRPGSSLLWKQKDNNSLVNLPLKTSNPWKKRSVNGGISVPTL